MEHRDQRQESHGVHVCNKCGWPFPNPHPSAKHRRAHKRVCGTIEGFKLVEDLANTVLTVSDDDGDQKSSSPKVLGESCSDKGVSETKTKSKESEEVFSDAVAEFSDGVGPITSIGHTFDSGSTPNMAAGDEVLVVAETSIDRPGGEQKNQINEEFVNLDADSGTPSSSSSKENQKVENLVVAETAVNRSGNEQETKFDQELVNVEISVVPGATVNQLSGTDKETKINEEPVDLETNFRSGDFVVSHNNHMNTTTASDLYSIEPETVVPPQQERKSIDGFEDVPQCSLPFPDTRYDEKKNEGFGLRKNLAETAASSGKMDNDTVEPVPKMEETIEILTEPTAHDGTLLPIVEDDMSIHSETPPSAVISDVKPIDLTRVTSNAQTELESCSFNNLLETDKLKEGNDCVQDHKDVKLTNCVVQDPHEGVGGLEDNFKDSIPKESYYTLLAEPFDQVSEVASFDTKTVEDRQRQERGVKNVSVDVITECSRNSCRDVEEIPIQEVNATQIERIFGENEEHDKKRGVKNVSVDVKTDCSKNSGRDVEEIPIQEVNATQIERIFGENEEHDKKRGVKNVSVDVKTDCSRNSGRDVEETPIQEVNATQIESIFNGNEEHDKNRTLSDAANFGTDGIPSASFSPEVEPMANSLDDLFENVTEVLSNENLAAPTGNQKKLDNNEVGNGGALLADDENKAEACVRKSEDTVQVRHPADARGRKDNGVGEKDKCDTLDIAGVEDERNPSKGKFLAEIDSTPESTTNSGEIKCSAIAEEIANESRRKFSGSESANSKSFDISLVSDTRQSVKEEDHGSAVHVAGISDVNSDDQSCHVRDCNTVQNDFDVHGNKEANLVSVSNEPVTGRSDASQEGSVSQLVETSQDVGVITDVKPQLTSSLLNASVDVSSQTDSLEGNWGSVSVLSTQSDLLAIVNGEVTLPARAVEEGTNSKNTEAATERQHSNRSDSFEPPSFMTWVEPNGQGIQNSATSEIQTARNRQQPNPASKQAGWFPSYTHVANDSPGRKMNEAIIAKVTNWSTGKPHTALKNLLDDAALENKQKSSPTQKGNLASMILKDEKPVKNGAVDRTVDSVARPKSPASPLGNKEILNEWNSPARYPSEMRRERRKGKPYWAQFVCCSSVH